jgi:hypothetical protein
MLAVNHFPEGFGGPLPGLNAREALAEVPAAVQAAPPKTISDSVDRYLPRLFY